MAMSSGGGGDGAPMMDINTTPLIDVMLVLLIMFIVTLPPATHAVKIDLPQDCKLQPGGCPPPPAMPSRGCSPFKKKDLPLSSLKCLFQTGARRQPHPMATQPRRSLLSSMVTRHSFKLAGFSRPRKKSPAA